MKLRFAEISTDKISFAIYNVAVTKVKCHQDFIVSLAFFQFFVNFKSQGYLSITFSSSLFFFAFLASFFSFVGYSVGFILVGKVLRKAFRTSGLGERKGWWAMEPDFHGDFQVIVTWFLSYFKSTPSNMAAKTTFCLYLVKRFLKLRSDVL